jgi:peptidoglycan/LPS O-acetylase OafA/YrhL
MAKKIYPLTSVRFFAASLVLFHHSVRTFLAVFSARGVRGVPKDVAGIVSLAFPVSASFFFFLSGYVLSFVYLHNVPILDKGNFFAARFARLYPLYFVVLVLDTPELLVPEIQQYGMKIGMTKTAGILAANVAMLQAWKGSRLVPIFAGFVWALSVIPSPISRWLCGRWVVNLGNASYALYLIHTPILSLFLHFRWVAQAFYPVYLALCVGLSLLSFRYFETPARLWLLGRFHKRWLRNTAEMPSLRQPVPTLGRLGGLPNGCASDLSKLDCSVANLDSTRSLY